MTFLNNTYPKITIVPRQIYAPPLREDACQAVLNFASSFLINKDCQVWMQL